MNSSGLVELAVYDLSRGMAKQFISSYLGIDVEAIYHTGVRVYGYEYFFSDGIQKMKPEEVILFNIIYIFCAMDSSAVRPNSRTFGTGFADKAPQLSGILQQKQKVTSLKKRLFL